MKKGIATQSEFDFYIPPDSYVDPEDGTIGIRNDQTGVKTRATAYLLQDYACRVIMSNAGYGMPDIEFIEQSGPYQNGQTLLDYRLQPRTISLEFRSNTNDRLAYWRERAELLNIFRVSRQPLAGELGLGVLRKILPPDQSYPDGDERRKGAVRDIKVLAKSGMKYDFSSSEEWDYNSLVTSIDLIAPDPTFYDPVLQIEPVALSANTELAFPKTIKAHAFCTAAVLIGDTSIPYKMYGLPTYAAKSETELIMAASGTITIVLTEDVAFDAQQAIRVVHNASNILYATVASYTQATRTIVAALTDMLGSGTYDTWVVSAIGRDDEGDVADILVNEILIIDGEKLQVAAVTTPATFDGTGTLTVTRGFGGTSAAAHSLNSLIAVTKDMTSVGNFAITATTYEPWRVVFDFYSTLDSSISATASTVDYVGILATNSAAAVGDVLFCQTADGGTFENEKMLVTAVISSTSVTVTRGYDGTTADAHSVGDKLVITTAAQIAYYDDSLGITMGSATLAEGFTIIYEGTWNAFPTIDVTGPWDNFTITNGATLETLDFGYNIAAGETVTFDLAYGVKSVTNQSGTNLIGSLSTDSDLASFHLTPDAEVTTGLADGVNPMTVTGTNLDENSILVLSWYTRYIGI